MPETIFGEIPQVLTVGPSGVSILTPTPSVVGLVLRNSGSQLEDAVQIQNSISTTYLRVGPDTLPGDGTKNLLSIVATLPSVLTGTMTAMSLQITGAGNSSQVIQTLNLSLLAGYTGSSSTNGLNIGNFSAGTGSDWVGGAANFGISATSRGTTTGNNVAIQGIARGGDISLGLFGRSTIAKNNAINAGVIGIALNTGTTPINIGGLFSLIGAKPTMLVSCGLICDNGATTADIFQARDQDTIKISIVDGGHMLFADGVNISFNTSTGTKWGTATGEKIGLWNVTPIVQPAGANQAAITDSTGGTAGFTLVDVATIGVADPAKINDNFASIARLVDNMRTAMVNFGSMKGAA